MVEIIRHAIERDGRTRYQIAKASGVDKAVLGRFVRGERGLNLDTADRLCRVLGIELRRVQRRKG